MLRVGTCFRCDSCGLGTAFPRCNSQHTSKYTRSSQVRVLRRTFVYCENKRADDKITATNAALVDRKRMTKRDEEGLMMTDYHMTECHLIYPPACLLIDWSISLFKQIKKLKSEVRLLLWNKSVLEYSAQYLQVISTSNKLHHFPAINIPD